MSTDGGVSSISKVVRFSKEIRGQSVRGRGRGPGSVDEKTKDSNILSTKQSS